MSLVFISTKDGSVEVPYSECSNILDNYLEDVNDNTNIQYVNIPDIKTTAIRHLLNIHHCKYSFTLDIEEVNDIKDAVNILGLSSELSDMAIKTFHCSDDGMIKDSYLITCEKYFNLLWRKSSEEEDTKAETGMAEFDQYACKSELVEAKLEPVEEDSDLQHTYNGGKKTPRKYTKGGGTEARKMKERAQNRLAMRAMVLAEPARARLFDRSGGRDKEVELRKFPGLIWNDQKTKFNICVDCCEVIFQKTLPTLKKHQCKTKTDILREKDIEIIETRSKFHNLNYLKQYYTEISVDKIKCNECDSELYKISELKDHLKKVHDIVSSNHMCPECGSMQASSMMLRQHQVEKHERYDLASYPCELCNRTFVANCLLTSHHKLIHSDEKPHICDVCAQGFKRKAHLDRHKILHTGERNYPCRYCEMAFGTEWTRIQHERRHLGIKPYKCNSCGQEFGQKTSLDSHNKVHHSDKYVHKYAL